MVEGIFNSPAVRSLRQIIRNAMFERGEWTTLSLDATCKVCFQLQGQASAEVSALAAFDDAPSKRGILTVRGRIGFVILMSRTRGEKDSTIAKNAAVLFGPGLPCTGSIRLLRRPVQHLGSRA